MMFDVLFYQVDLDPNRIDLDQIEIIWLKLYKNINIHRYIDT